MSNKAMKMNRRTFLSLLGASGVAVGFSGRLVASEPKKVALIMVGSIADGGWNTLAYKGLTTLKETGGYETAYVENLSQARIPEVVRGYADDGFDLIIGHGYEFGAAFEEIGPEYPDQSFFASTFAPVSSIPPNVQYADLAYVSVAYAAGALAALISDSGKSVGFVGGGDNPTQQAMGRAFVGGAEESRSGLKGYSIVTGDYNNAAKGKEAALTMTGNGADVIWHAADVTGLGAIQGASSAGAKVIGCYANQTSVAPGTMATSFVMNLPWLISELGRSLSQGEFSGGVEWKPTVMQAWTPTYGDGENTTAVNADMVSDEALRDFERVMSELSNGAIDVNRFL